jgi:hypothetical protein
VVPDEGLSEQGKNIMKSNHPFLRPQHVAALVLFTMKSSHPRRLAGENDRKRLMMHQNRENPLDGFYQAGAFLSQRAVADHSSFIRSLCCSHLPAFPLETHILIRHVRLQLKPRGLSRAVYIHNGVVAHVLPPDERD